MSAIFYGCISMDGYLAGKNHDLSWLYDSGSVEETGYDDFYDSMDIAIMGRNTFDEIIKTTVFHQTYPTTENYVFSNRNDVNMQGAKFISGDVVNFVKEVDKKKNIWIVGGGGILHPLLEANLIDKMYVQIAPVILGGGIPLFKLSDHYKKFLLTEVNKYGQFAELVYER